MAKFIPPSSVVKVAEVPDENKNPKLWPLGTAFVHVPTGIYFRFISHGGGRGSPGFAVSTDRGIFCATGYKDTLRYAFEFPSKGNIVCDSDKNRLINLLCSFLETL